MDERTNILIFCLLVTIFVLYFSKYSQVIEDKRTLLPEKININIATRDEITKLPFIGEKRANKIIELRDKEKVSAEKLEKVLGEKTFRLISSLITY